MNQTIIGKPHTTNVATTIATKTAITNENIPLATKENNNENASPPNNNTNGGETPEELKKQFSQFKFYLDNIDDQQQKKIRDRLKIFLATVEPFFSKKCTHVVTTRPIPKKLTALNENKHVDDTISIALKWNLKIWSLDHMNRVMQSMVYGHSSGHRANRTKAIGKLLEDEKKYGVGTNHGGSTNARNITKQVRPMFVPFQKYYLSVEDTRGVYRPVAVKEYEPGRPYPYPKITPGGKSPFISLPHHHVLPPLPPRTPSTPKSSSQPLPSEKEEQKQPTKEIIDKENDRPSSQQTLPNKPHPTFAKPLEPSKATTMIPNPVSTPPMSPIDQSMQQQQQHPNNLHDNINNINNNIQYSSSHLKASGLYPSQSTNAFSRTTRATLTNSRIISTTSESTTKLYMDNAQPHDERVAQLDRRMVDNNRASHGSNNNGSLRTEGAASGGAGGNIHPNTGGVGAGNSKQLLKTAAMNQTAKEKEKLRQEQEKTQAQKKKEQDLMHWCENCNKRYINLKEHLEEKAHQTFVQDVNNFSKFDELVATIRRPKLQQQQPSNATSSKDVPLKNENDMDIDP
ncbi:hypothetical protein BDA99DRAFT_556995 [Phascolomyces articulosus]|uniref:DBF4-type domain-containing protein n=1 Tax=Phascolomyces articulosus TaxID=60185 RepID=A0AAD5PH49_9FUNG|nr:hypothetical protein BDA99DRAFT_556995 [Phascolomyces articulosus]